MRLCSLIAVLTAASASAALAQDLPLPIRAEPNALMPTRILEGGEIAGTVRTDFASLRSSFSSTGLSADATLTRIRSQVELAAGLGKGFEAELELPYQFQGHLEGDGDTGGIPLDVKQDEKGLGDLTLRINYRIFKENPDRPHWMAGIIAVVPSGDDTEAEPEINGSPGETGGIGDGVFQYGLQTGVSRKFGTIEGYALVSCLFPTGQHKDDDIKTDEPDRFSLTLGTEIQLSRTVTLDTRAILDRIGDEVDHESGFPDSTEEAHFQAGLQVRTYVDLGSHLTLVIGVGGQWIQDHATDKEAGIDIQDLLEYSGEIGLHLRLAAFK